MGRKVDYKGAELGTSVIVPTAMLFVTTMCKELNLDKIGNLLRNFIAGVYWFGGEYSILVIY